jgi:cell division protease FtsH
MSVGMKPKAHSPDTARAIDEEIRNIIDGCYAKAKKLLEDNEDKLHAMANALIELETLNSDQIDDIMAGAKPREPDETPPSASSEDESDAPPIGGPAEEH